MQNFNSAELRPVEFARAYLQKKMLKKPLREDAGADVLRDSPCSAHVSRKLCISPARITHRCLSLPPLIGAREHVLECVLEREFAKSLFSLPVICMQNSPEQSRNLECTKVHIRLIRRLRSGSELKCR